jgi:branched-chain amino acid aminotransferase
MKEMQEPRSKLPEIAVWRAEIDSRGVTQLKKIELKPAPKSFDQASQALTPGVYTTFRTFDGDKILGLSEHVKRLQESASLVGQPIQIKIGPLRDLVREAVLHYPSHEKRVRLSVDLESCGGVVYVFIESLHTLKNYDYAHGVKVVTFLHKRQNPKAKRTEFINTANSIRKNISGDYEDVLMSDQDGFILEGLNSNFFAIKQGEIFTASENVLSGITREMVLRIINQLDVPLHLSPVNIADLEKLDEGFLTSASRAVLPIAQIDGFKIGTSIPGPITTRITKAYWEYVSARLEDL